MLSHYLLIEKIGEGGMGVVWKAEDQVLRRAVAIKVLPAETVTDERRRRMFLREARLASAVNHPHIVQVYEFAREGELDFIVTELIEGQPLSQTLRDRPLPSERVVEYGEQIASAVAHAHRKGLLHRDLKPGNILLTAEGVVKVVDFGLAMLFERLEAASDVTDTAVTEGKIVGTLPYMSPEQLRGERLDARSDVFSFGVVLYEMTTGVRPFRGIERKRPRPVHTLVADVPFDLDRIVHKALAGPPSERYQTMEDLAVDLKRLSRELASGSSPSYENLTRPKPVARKWAVVTVVGILACALVVAALWLRPEAPRRSAAPVHRQLTFSGTARAAEVSPDGQFVACLEGPQAGGGNRVQVQDLSGGEPLEIFAADFVGHFRWSPSGTELLVSARTQSGWADYLVPRLGGAARKVDGPDRIAWSPDGIHYASSALTWKKLWIVDKNTGAHRPLSLEPDFVWLDQLDWSSRDRLAILTRDAQGHSTIRTIPAEGGREVKLVDDAAWISTMRWGQGGTSLYYLWGGTDPPELRRIEVDPAMGEARGPAQSVLTGVPISSFSFSGDATVLAYARTTSRANLWIVHGDEATQLTSGTADDEAPRVSPDGRQVAFVRNDDVYTVAVDGGQPHRLTFTAGREWCPVWSPDGAWIAFGSDDGGAARVWKVPTAGGPSRAFDRTRVSVQLAWAPGRKILYMQPGNRNFIVLDPETAEETPLLRDDTVGNAFSPAWSPDGSKVALSWIRRRDSGLWTISLADSSEKRLTSAKLNPVAWSVDGQWIYAYDDRWSKVLRIPAAGGNPEPFFDRQCQPFPDARRWLCTKGESTSDVWIAHGFDAVR
jgi:Tol biopolymer transport system component/tRNA A-37 threonylcarbamoyl transferase component Bud32